MKSLLKSELDALLAVAEKHDRNFALMIRVSFNHGLRVTEAINLSSTNIVDGHLVVQREKKSALTTQPLLADEKAALEALARTPGRFFPISRVTAWRRMQAYGEEAGIPEFKRHSHVLKHTCGKLAFKGGMTIPEIQTWLGHKNGGNTMVYLQATEQEAAQAFAAAVGK
jgi:type 1 fimbriae regulatory protein FimB/type 1 fimbriae regulatory protein FimE